MVMRSKLKFKDIFVFDSNRILDDYDAYSHFNKNTIIKSNESKELSNI